MHACTLAPGHDVPHDAVMRHEGSITTLSWIPPEAVEGLAKLPFGAGVAHWDQRPPEAIFGPGTSLDELRAGDRFRFANRLAAWLEVDDDGHVVGAGYSGGGSIGSTTLALGGRLTVAAVALPDKQAEPEFGDGWVRFLQTAGGRTGVPAPRTVRRPPFVQYHAPIAWSTLSLTIHADGRLDAALVGASPFPRHWVYDHAGTLVAKSGVIDFTSWYKEAFGDHTPWGDLDSPAFVMAVESAVEQQLVAEVMRSGRQTTTMTAEAGEVIIRQGDVGDDVMMLLDGVLGITVDGVELGHLGPGVVLGERAALEGGLRTSTLTAVTRCRLAIARAADLDRIALHRISLGHRREDARP
jgi:hypothetical protein